MTVHHQPTDSAPPPQELHGDGAEGSQDGDKQPLARGKIALAILGFVIVVVMTALSVLYALSYFNFVGYEWPVVYIDGFWRWFDGSVERLKLFASLLPLLVVVVAYLVYRSDQWWKRAEWALDAATADITDDEAAQERNRRTLGLEAMEELAAKRMAPRKDEELFEVLTRHAVSIQTERLARRARARSVARYLSATSRPTPEPDPNHGREGLLGRIMKKRASKGGGGSCR